MTVRLLVVLSSLLVLTQALYLDVNEWIRIDYVSDSTQWNETTVFAQDTVISTAHWLAAQGPWTVTTKAKSGILAPTGNPHDYLSWRPYFFPNCDNVHNTTELTPQEVWKECNYERRDGEMNPDLQMVNDTQDCRTMSDAVFYNTLAFAITEDNQYAENAVNFIYTWFLNPDTYMNPNLDYSQVLRGPTNPSGKGSHTGVLDLKGFTKISSAILYFRKNKTPQWKTEYDTQMVEWCKQYIQWLTTSSLALEEKKADNNHGSFYFAQLAAIQVLVGDTDGAKKTLNEFFDGIFMQQIVENGEQPLEAARTHPYHYRAYNAAAVLVICEISKYLGIDGFSKKTAHGATIQDAVDHAMLYDPGEEEAYLAYELYPLVANVASQYGDPTGKYVSFLRSKLNNQFSEEPFFFWDQPLDDGGYYAANPPSSDSTNNRSGNNNSSSGGSNSSKNSALSHLRVDSLMSYFLVLVAGVMLVL